MIITIRIHVNLIPIHIITRMHTVMIRIHIFMIGIDVVMIRIACKVRRCSSNDTPVNQMCSAIVYLCMTSGPFSLYYRPTPFSMQYFQIRPQYVDILAQKNPKTDLGLHQSWTVFLANIYNEYHMKFGP